MPFPTQNRQQTLDAALDRAQKLALQIRNRANAWSAQSAANNMLGWNLIVRLEQMIQARDAMNALIAIPGLAAHADAELGRSGSGAEFVAIRDQLEAVMAWVGTNLPKRGSSDFVDIIEVTDAGIPIKRTFTPAQTAGLRVELDALAALID